MKLLKQVFDFYINSSIHVALAVVSLCLVTYLNYDLPVNVDVLFFIFFGSITGYNFVKYAGLVKLHHSNLAKGLKIIQIFSFFIFLLLMWFALKIGWELVLYSAFFGLFTLLYALPVFSEKRNLRSISGIKVFVIAFVWAGVTVVLPFIDGVGEISGVVYLEFIQRFLWVLVLILPFEIRDLKYDLEQLGTIPQQIGVTKTKIFGFVLLAILLLLELVKERRAEGGLLALLIVVFVTGLFIARSRERQSSYFSSFWVEGIPIFWAVLLYLFKSF